MWDLMSLNGADEGQEHGEHHPAMVKVDAGQDVGS